MSGYRRPRMSAGLYLGEKTAPYVAPWLITVAAMPVATLIHFTIGSDPKWMAVTGVLSTCLAFGTWKTWRHRKHETRVTATLLTVGMLGWVTLAGAGTPWSGDLFKAWIVGGFSGSLFWCIRHAGTVGGHERDRTDKDSGSWLADKVSAFKNSRTDKASVKETDSELRFRTTLDAPTTAGDAQHAKEQIAAVAGVGADQVNVLKVKGDESKVDVVLTHRTDTSRPVRYRGPSAPGQSIAAAPLWLGRRTDGSDIEWWIVGSTDPANPRPLAHTKCTGVTGAGKTETICTAVLDMRWRTDVVPVVADPAKFQQGFGDIAECLGLSARDERQVKQLIVNLKEVVEYRADLFGRLERADGTTTGYKQWEPELYTRHGIPAVFLDVEEAADVAMQMDLELDEAVRKLRSIGIHLCLSMQTMPHDNLPRKARGQFTQSLAHGQQEYQDAKYALSNASLEAGADPTKWSNDAPGSLYAEMTGTDKSHWPIDGRAACMSAAEKRMSIEGSRQFWAELDPGTLERLSFALEETEATEESEEEIEPPTTEELTGMEVDPNEPLTPPPAGLGFTFGPVEPKVTLSTEEARRRLMNRLEVLAKGNHHDITFDDLASIPDEVGKTPGWVYNQLKLLVDAGVLKMYKPPRGKAIYTILPKPSESSTA